MAKKHLKTDGMGRVVDEPKEKTYRAKVKPYKEPETIRRLRLERERLFWKENPEQREEIEEYVKSMKEQWETQDKRE